jgi:hypothetical protein
MLVIGFGIYAVANLVYAHSLLTGSYLPSDLINASWLVVFGLIATAAHEQGWLSSHSRTAPPQAIIAREAWLEAVVPALLIIIMVIVAVGSSTALTPRVVSWAAGLFILFAIILDSERGATTDEQARHDQRATARGQYGVAIE